MSGPSAGDFGVVAPGWAGTSASPALSDHAFVQAMLDVESTWALVLARRGLITATQAEVIAAACRIEHVDVAELARQVPAGGNALIPLLGAVRRQAARHDPAAASLLHLGLTSQDVLDTAFSLLLSRAGATLVTDLSAASARLAALADEHAADLCVARSLTQHALPMTFGLRCAQWLSAVGSANARIGRALAALPVQFGGAAGTRAALVDWLDARGEDSPTASDLASDLAAELGLTSPDLPWHTDRLPITQIASALADVVAAAGKIAADVLVLARPEVGEVSEAVAGGAGGSSAMPQKRNPVRAVLIRSAALSAPGHLAQLYTAAGSAADERPDGAWHAEWSALRELARLALGASAHLKSLSGALRVHREAMLRNLALTGDALLSERLAVRLAPLLPGGAGELREIVRESLDSSSPLAELLRGRLGPELISDADLASLLDPSHYLGETAEFIERAVAAHHQETSR